MSNTDNTAGSELAADGSESKKGRFTVKFAIGRADSGDAPEMSTPITPLEPPSPSGKL